MSIHHEMLRALINNKNRNNYMLYFSTPHFLKYDYYTFHTFKLCIMEQVATTVNLENI